MYLNVIFNEDRVLNIQTYRRINPKIEKNRDAQMNRFKMNLTKFTELMANSHKLLTFQSDLIGKTRYDQNES